MLAKCLEVLPRLPAGAGFGPGVDPGGPAAPANPAVFGAVEDELFRIRARSSVNLA